MGILTAKIFYYGQHHFVQLFPSLNHNFNNVYLLMGAEFEACKKVDSQNHSQEIHLQPHKPFQIKSHRHQYCSSQICGSDNKSQHFQNSEQRRRALNTKYNSTPFKSTRTELTAQKLGSGLHGYELSNSKKRVDGHTIQRRRVLSSTLSAKLGLTGTSHMTQQMQQNEQLFHTKEKMRSIINNICVNDQDQLIDIIDKLENGFRRDKSQASGSEHYAVNGELLDFLTSVEKAELDFLDMLYHNDQLLYQKKLKDLTFKNNVEVNIINLKEAMMEEREFQGSEMVNYEKYKKIGFELIRNKKVCFFIMSGGKGSRFAISSHPKPSEKTQDSNKSISKQFHPLQIPSERGILEIIIRRFLALTDKYDCEITLFLGTSAEKVKDLQTKIFNLTNKNQKLTIYPFAHKVMGAIDLEGKVVIEDDNLPSLWAVGTADIWNVLMGDKSLSFPSVKDLMAQGFEYVQVLGTSNALQKCFDCFALGLAKSNNLDWTTKIVESFEKHKLFNNVFGSNLSETNIEPKIFENILSEIYVCDPQQLENYPKYCRYTFINSSIFRLEYLQKVFKSTQWQNLQPRKKIHAVGHKPPFSRYQTIISYERDYTDIFRMSKVKHKPQGCGFEPFREQTETQEVKWRLILCDQGDYYPLIYSSHQHSDLKCASEAIMDLHCKYLGIQKRIRVQIDPAVSLEGEDLQKIREQIIKNVPSEDQQIFIQIPEGQN